MNLTAHHLRVTLDVETPIELDEHPGAALRGMLFNALRGPRRRPELGFCTQRHLNTCAECPLVAVCPVAGLVATLNPQADRGRDVPRPYAIVPPGGDKRCYQPGESLTFGLTLFGQALNLFPYLVMALRQAGPGGLGRKQPSLDSGRLQRGEFSLQAVHAVNLLSGEVQEVLQEGSTLVQQPSLPVTPDQVEAAGRQLLSQPVPFAANGNHEGSLYQPGQNSAPLTLTLHFRTPTRIIEQGRLLKEPDFAPIFHRLLNRLLALSREFGPQTALPHQADSIGYVAKPVLEEAGQKEKLLRLTDQVELVDNQTYWQDLWSYSARKGGKTPIGGFMGQASYHAPYPVWRELLPYLLWGTVIHVGKNAVKGDGVIAVSR